MRSLVVPAYKRFGTDFQTGDVPIVKLLRVSMITQACALEHKPCVQRAQAQFDKWMETGDIVHYKS